MESMNSQGIPDQKGSLTNIIKQFFVKDNDTNIEGRGDCHNYIDVAQGLGDNTYEGMFDIALTGQEYGFSSAAYNLPIDEISEYAPIIKELDMPFYNTDFYRNFTNGLGHLTVLGENSAQARLLYTRDNTVIELTLDDNKPVAVRVCNEVPSKYDYPTYTNEPGIHYTISDGNDVAEIIIH